MPDTVDISPRPVRPRQLLTQNRELKAIGVWNWTLPAWAGRLDDGRTFNTCPSAGICAKVCYARQGTYLWPVVRAKHHANLTFVLDDLPGWEAAMLTELAAWLRICRARPDLHFYAYTKEVDRFRRLVEPDPPANFLWVNSYGSLASSNCCCRSRVSTCPCCSPCCQSDRTTATGRTCRPPPTRGPAQVL